MLQMNTILSRLRFHEGLSLSLYKDTRDLNTIGIGKCVDTNPLTPEEEKVCGDWRHGITIEMAHYLCRNDINRCIESLEKLPFWKNLDSERQYALLDMHYQMGKGVFKFKKMLKAMENKNFILASKECLDSNYHKQTPKRCERIANLIRTGVWSRD